MAHDIEERLRVQLDSVASKFGEGNAASDRVWTREIKSRLCALGQELHYDVCASGCDNANEGEWLYDLVWSHGGDDEMWTLPLVVESEWRTGMEDIKWDFGKLLAAKSPLKLFIFQQSTLSAATDTITMLKRLILAFRTVVPGERYLLAGYAWSDRRFAYETIVV